MSGAFCEEVSGFEVGRDILHRLDGTKMGLRAM